uniref:ZM domain-containing protein n=1 Tax=Gongylonema pulchrum TaxID=637853 RepID=A0A183DLJ5_9BILA
LPAAQPYVFDIAEPDIRVAPSKLGSFADGNTPHDKNLPNRDAEMAQNIRDGRVMKNEEPQVPENHDGDAKSDDSIPTLKLQYEYHNPFQIETLLKVPGVQQVAVVQSNARISENGPMRGQASNDGLLSNSVFIPKAV